MKVVILGGSAQSTPVLFGYLGRQAECPALEVYLAGRTARHLTAVSRASRLLLGLAPVSLQACGMQSSELALALRDAAIVLVQIRFGGYAGRHFDETFPLKYGLCGDEGLGPGGLAAAWRAWPSLLELLDLSASVCPDALVILLSSPVSLLVGAAATRYPALRVFGICELPWVALQEVATAVDVPPASLDFDYFGLNHLGWFYRLEFDGQDLLARYARSREGSSSFPSGELIRTCGGIPTKYLRLHYQAHAVLQKQLSQLESRAESLAKISEESYQAYLHGDLSAIQQALLRRPAPWYAEAVGPLLLACAGRETDISFFLSARKGVFELGFEATDVLETAYSIRSGTFLPRRNRAVPPEGILQTVQRFVQYERRACRALVDRDARQLAEALAAHPWMEKQDVVPLLVEETVSGQGAMKSLVVPG
jgi:6-phospho-beta-glucosidase